MFKIEVFVDDKKLGDVLRALTGLVRGQPAVVPVVNVEEEGEEIKASSNGSLLGLFTKYINQSHAVTITPAEVSNWLEKHGKSRLSSSYLLKQAVGSRLLRRTGNSAATVYHVRRAK